ncbi:protein phosphatase 2C domain-containing protein [Actinoplanes regularis]|uniref:Serine/threonine protein phosphatase PrpC n=1 Tax=Actinoplanes regularis TaxID=52697 RepID=A0A239C467_9ACTN|nr:protein phosphatase 2C domain-containing protein [Actinoplanes regularis]GIE88119.1 hypothetical protein Are01nite_45990 [Actinoplanes regularis]SNS14976.1 Serine/threonine protein phosphatase PrpC [Actinoplanes regularis]
MITRQIAVALFSMSALVALILLGPLVYYATHHWRRSEMAVLNPVTVAEVTRGMPLPRNPPGPAAGSAPTTLDCPRLPRQLVLDCRWHVSHTGGWCGPPDRRSRMLVGAVAARGGMHAAMDQEGQDAVGAAWDPATGRLLTVVADGLGSLPDSGVVAVNAVQAALYLWAKRTGEEPLHELGDLLFRRVAQGLEASFGAGVAQRGGTTLVAAELVPDEGGATVTVQGVGDSEAWLLAGDEWEPVHHERPAGFDGNDNATRDLPGDPRPRTWTGRVPHGGLLLLATDGFAGRMASGRSNEWMRRPLTPADLAREIIDVKDTYSDDSGVVAVWVD